MAGSPADSGVTDTRRCSQKREERREMDDWGIGVSRGVRSQTRMRVALRRPSVYPPDTGYWVTGTLWERLLHTDPVDQ